MLPRRIRFLVEVWLREGVKEKEMLKRVNLELNTSEKRHNVVSRKRIRTLVDQIRRKPKLYCKKGLTRIEWERVKKSVEKFFRADKKASTYRAIKHIRDSLNVSVRLL